MRGCTQEQSHLPDHNVSRDFHRGVIRRSMKVSNMERNHMTAANVAKGMHSGAI